MLFVTNPNEDIIYFMDSMHGDLTNDPELKDVFN